jgi:hypothetical protein
LVICVKVGEEMTDGFPGWIELYPQPALLALLDLGIEVEQFIVLLWRQVEFEYQGLVGRSSSCRRGFG